MQTWTFIFACGILSTATGGRLADFFKAWTAGPGDRPEIHSFNKLVNPAMPKITVQDTETGEVKIFKMGYGGNLRKAALFNSVGLYKGMNEHLNCRGMGSCGTCLIEVEPLANVNGHSLIEKLHKVGGNKKLGCRTKVYGDITIKAKLVD
ncbi:MAG: hypothetical protein ACE5ER_00015 [Nitrospinaceae bacterium]